MKKLVMTMLTVVTCGAAYALPVGNPTEASIYTHGFCMEASCCDPCDPCFSWCDAWSIRLGFYGDYVFNRNMESDVGSKPDVEEVTMHTNAALIALNICDRVDIFATLGATQFQVRNSALVFVGANFGVFTETNFTTEFSWSIGGRATLWECDCWGIGLEGQYFQTCPNLDNFINYANGGQVFYNDNTSTKYHEWQVGLGASYTFTSSCHPVSFIPYTAIKWAGGRWDFNDFILQAGVPGQVPPVIFPNLKPKKLWGWALGATWTYCDMIGFTVEGRWADEKALHVNGQFRF